MTEKDKRKLRGIVLKNLEFIYPDGMTLGFLRALLVRWYEPHFLDLLQLRKTLSYLIDNQYVELGSSEWTENTLIKITPKGLLLLKGELKDLEVSVDG
ncbi:MAG: hypothetical protein DSY32_03190 [Aquifex sp.]|nr:MAG: hypothetical protein DSY32_03190 [Aquifex sp.]